MDMLLLFNICTIAICTIQLKRRLQNLLCLNMSAPLQSQKTMIFVLPKILIADVDACFNLATGSKPGLGFITNSAFGSISKSHHSQYCIDGVSDISDDEIDCLTSDLSKTSKDAVRRYTSKSYAKTNTTHHAKGNTVTQISSFFVDTVASYINSTVDGASLEDEENEIKGDKDFINNAMTISTDSSKYINDFDLDMFDTYSTTASESGSDVDDDNSSVSSVDLDLDQDWSWLNEGLCNTDSRDSSDVDSDSGFCDTKSTTSSRDDVMDLLSCNVSSDVNDDIGDLREWNWLVSTHFI